ncbi:MAG: hypothetical protein CMQ14_00365 [Gammaproteobacteria bacterium]|nr:hypothetical protein [Gammaproteobacteria bacterium]
MGPSVSGEALVAADNFSARYDLDRIKGVFSRPQHLLFGQSYTDKILVLNTAKGGVATAWMLHEMFARGVAPKAMVLNSANTILAQGAAMANMTLVDRFVDGDITKLIKTGQVLTVNPQAGHIQIVSS